jgi:hypothetical protein
MERDRPSACVGDRVREKPPSESALR